MKTNNYSLPYPRKKWIRFFIRFIGRLILPILFEIRISGKNNFPRKGPLLVVGNHTAAMEAVLLKYLLPLAD